jgi:hypothetical protein
MNDIQVISSKIMTLPNRPPFMLDRDLAMIYGTTPKKLNQAVKRNRDRFPDDFIFQLTKEEAEICGFDDFFKVTDCDLKNDGRGKHAKYLPYGFTREGCNQLSAVLKTPAAVARSVQIMRSFSAMERGETAMQGVLEKIADVVSDLSERVKDLESKPSVNINLPDDTALPIAIERKFSLTRGFEKRAYRFPEVREMILSMRRQGRSFLAIEQAIKATWPDKPEKHVSKSSIHRFWTRAKKGKLKEFGIDVTIH